MLAYTAQHEAKVALHNILNPSYMKTPKYEPLPYAIFSAYEIGYIGENEETAKDKDKLIEKVKELFDLSPAGIIEYLHLRRPIYRKTSVYGHFGHKDEDFYPWEQLNTNIIKELEALK